MPSRSPLAQVSHFCGQYIQMYMYTYIIYWVDGLSSVLVFIAPLLSAYFRLDLLLTWLNENILTYFDIALDILVLLLVVSFHVVSLSEWDHAKKNSSATQLWRGAWLLGAVLYTVHGAGREAVSNHGANCR